MNRYKAGNSITLLCNGAEYFPVLLEAIALAEREIWLETYIFADDETGRRVADALIAAARRGVTVRVLVDGWGARHYLTPALAQRMIDGGVDLLKYRPEVMPWHFRSHRLRRLHRKVCHVDGRVAFVGGINVIDDMNTPGHTPPRIDFAVSVRGPLLVPIIQTMQRVWAIVEIAQLRNSDVPLFPDEEPAESVGTQVAKFTIRDNLRHRRDIERAYLAAVRTARREILIATAYFFPGVRFRRALVRAASRGVKVTLLLQARVEYRLLHHAARALYGQLLAAGVAIQEYHRSFLHAKVAVVDGQWATVGSSNIDPYSFLMAREANVFVRDPVFAHELREALVEMIETGAYPVPPQDWAHRSRLAKAANWIAYGIVRVAMGMLRYGRDEWWGEVRG
ncbi:MAG TPA: cardiolipin synthase ClsB [Casimicrobiaceae bacterium]|jgi:cardiolipin synthase|nr:cardiolipin synthase ClsB [Casimicrobiaceae bacterium]